MSVITKVTLVDGTERWQARVSKPGKKRLVLTFESEELAKEWADLAEAQPTMDTSVMHGVTGRMLVERYADTINDPKNYVSDFLASPLADLTLAQLTPEAINEHAKNWIEANPRKIPGQLAVFREAWNLFSADNPGAPLPENPVTALRLTKKDYRNRRLSFLEEAEIRQSFSEARTMYLDAAMTLALDTGMQQSEIVRLEWKDINFGKRELVVSGRVIPLTNRLCSALNLVRGNIESETYIFGDLTTAALHRAFKRRLLSIGIEDLTFTDLRNEAIHRMKESGLSKEQVRKILGYKTGDNLDRIYGKTQD